MNGKQMRGVYTVEFAIIGLLLFVLLFGVLEMGRLLFTVNALDEVVRRGARLAAVCNVTDLEQEKVKQRAIFNNNGEDDSPLIANLTTSDLTLAYLNENGAEVLDPTSDNGFRAIRYVQLRVDNFTFDLLIPVLGGNIGLPVFRSTLPRENLGRSVEGDTEC
ncbi:TadE-like protein [compost metagenome]